MSSDEPRGLGGWLILPMLGLIITPIRLAFLLITTFLPIFTQGNWTLLTTKGSEFYHPFWAPVIIFEIVGNIAFILFTLLLLVLMFRRDPRFPKLIIAYFIANVLFVGTDHLAGNLIPAVAAEPDAESLREVFRSVANAALWIPYFLVSKRVKNTFSLDRPPPLPPAEPTAT